MIMERRLHKVINGKWAELMVEEKKFDALESRLGGFPAKRRYRPLAGAESYNTFIWEREWESQAAADEAYGRWENSKDAEIIAESKKVSESFSKLIEDGRMELFYVV